MSINTWQIGPPNTAFVGVISNPTYNSVDVTWDPSAISNHGYLLYSFTAGGYTDTLWPQCLCSATPAGATGIRDADDFIGGSATIRDAFHSTSSTQPTSIDGNGVVQVYGGIYFIEGQLNLNATAIQFNPGTQIYMGSGAVIYTKTAWSPPLGSFIAHETHFDGTPCGMWRGIVAPGDGRIELIGSFVNDAEFAIQMRDCILGIYCDNTSFNNNYVSIFAPHIENGGFISSNNYFYRINYPLKAEFHGCTFDSQSPMTLPTFNGQYGIPIFQKPFAGMFLNDIVPYPAGSPAIPFATASGPPCLFQNMNNGIYAINSQVDVYNCNFENIHDYSTTGNLKYGRAIYSDNTCSYCNTPKSLSVGNANTNSQNIFDGCYYGVYTNGEIDATVLSNDFTCTQNLDVNRRYNVLLSNSYGNRTLNINDNNFSGYCIGIGITSVTNANLTIWNNHFYGDPLLNFPNYYPSFASTGIYITERSTANVLHAEIGLNVFNNSRIGMYFNGVQGTSQDSHDFNIQDNTINNDISFNDLSYLYNGHINSYGIWCDDSRYINMDNNHFYRSFPVQSAPANFDQMLRALNIKQCNYININSSNILSFGTPMRFVSNCNYTNLDCNTMYECYSGIYLDYALMTQQGYPGNPWDNTWTNFGNIDRVSGISLGGAIYWYHRDPTCTTLPCTNDYSPWPYSANTVFPFQNENGPECGSGGCCQEAMQRLSDIVNDSIAYSDYPDESRYMDKEFAFQALKADSTLLDSNPDFQNFYTAEKTGNIGKFDEAKDDALSGNLIAALAKLNIIVDQNNIEYNKKYVRTLELQKKISGDETFTEQETEDLTMIAFQTAWEGGDAVFDARRMLMKEVDDQEHNLRIAHWHNKPVSSSLLAFPNPSKGAINFYADRSKNGELRITDTFGKIIHLEKLINGRAAITDLANGVYSAQLIENGNFLNVQKFIIIK